jgi:hypothetical protein
MYYTVLGVAMGKCSTRCKKLIALVGGRIRYYIRAMKRILPPGDSTTGTLPVSIRLSPNMKALALAHAKEEGMGISEFFRTLLERHDDERPLKKRRPGGRRS